MCSTGIAKAAALKPEARFQRAPEAVAELAGILGVAPAAAPSPPEAKARSRARAAAAIAMETGETGPGGVSGRTPIARGSTASVRAPARSRRVLLVGAALGLAGLIAAAALLLGRTGGGATPAASAAPANSAGR